MKYWYDYQELYNTKDDEYYKYVDEQLKKIIKRHNNENEIR
jgi:hypothetical protein